MKNSPLSLSDVLYSFSLEQDEPSAALIDEYQRRFPDYAVEIARFALELSLDARRPDVVDVSEEDLHAAPSAAVMRSISRFQNARHKAMKEETSPQLPSKVPAETAHPSNPFLALDVGAMRQLAKELDANTVLINKLRDRQILAETIPAAFSQKVAARLGVPVEILRAHLAVKQTGQFQAQYFKAIKKPELRPQESFEAAVRSSGLTLEQQQRLLSKLGP